MNAWGDEDSEEVNSKPPSNFAEGRSPSKKKLSSPKSSQVQGISPTRDSELQPREETTPEPLSPTGTSKNQRYIKFEKILQNSTIDLGTSTNLYIFFAFYVSKVLF
jgi:hypothetical protein